MKTNPRFLRAAGHSSPGRVCSSSTLAEMFCRCLAGATLLLTGLAGATGALGQVVTPATVVVEHEDFESFTPGGGTLAPPLNIFVYGSALATGDGSGDRLSGVLNTSVLGTGKAGYLGGAGTNLTFTPADGNFGAEIWAGPSNFPTVQVIGSPRPVITGGDDFAVHFTGGTNQESFIFFVYDGQYAALGGFAFHSTVIVDGAGNVLIQDNDNSSYLGTGVTITGDTPYHLQVSVNYNTATWSATLTDKNTLQTHILASDRAINDSNYTLSGWATPSGGWFDVELYANSVSATNALFSDQLIFDNFKTTASIPPVLDQLSTGTNWAYDAGQTFGSGSFVFQNNRMEYLAASPTAHDQIQAMPVPGANGTPMTFGPGASNAMVGSTAADWSARVKIHAGSLALGPGQGFHAALAVYNLQDTHYDNGLNVFLEYDPNVPVRQIGSFTWGNNLGQFVTTAATDVTVLASYISSIHTLGVFYSLDDGGSWNQLFAFDVTQSNANGGWGMTDTSTASFGISLFASSSNASGTGPVIAPGDIYYTNFAYAGLSPDNWPIYVPAPVAPSISSQPVGATVAAGGSVTLNVAASGTPDPTYQWYLNGVGLTDGTQPDGSTVSGSGSANLSIANLQADENNASLTVVVTNSQGSITSSAATITVTAAPSSFAFHAIGDLPGGSAYSEIRDAVRTPAGIIAVGNAAQSPSATVSDTDVSWTPAGGLVPLPSQALNTTSNKFITASAISANGNAIAGRTRSVAVGDSRLAALYTNHGSTLTVLGALPGGGPTVYSAANGLSADGSVVYGFSRYNNPSTGMEAFRWTASEGMTPLGFLSPGDHDSSPAGRGVSADGSVLVGASSVDGTAATSHAYRYVQGSGMQVLSMLAGGTWTAGLGLTPDGQTVLGTGNSPAFPNGELIRWNIGSATPIEALGSPNSSKIPGNFAGLTADGQTAVISFYAQNDTDNSSGVSYLRNAHGWSALPSVFASAGMDLTGWTLTNVFGVSSDGTLIYGSGLHNGNTEGWVAEVPAGFLAGVIPPAIAPSILSQPAGATVAPDGSVTLTVAASGTPDPTYQWYFNGVQVPGAVNASLALGDVQPANAGDYYVVVTNSAGSVTSNVVTITVTPSPTVTSVTPWQKVFAGNSATFTVSATGATGYQWQDSTDGGATWTTLTEGGSFSGTATASLTVNGVNAGMNGWLFRAVVSNAGGSSTTSASTLTLVFIPTTRGIAWGVGGSTGGLAVFTPKAIATGVAAVTTNSSTGFVKSDGTLWTAGDNTFGQLGDGTTVSRSIPEQVASNATQVSGGSGYFMFIKTDGTLWGMGTNGGGQIGDGTNTDRHSPVQVPGVSGVVAVSAGGQTTLFLKADGTLWAMGDNSHGQFGNGTTTGSLSPVQVGTGVSAIAAAPFTGISYILKSDGSLWSVGGLNGSGQLGNGTTADSTTPTQVATGVAAVATGSQHAMFVKTDGTLWGMGDNNSGQLGDGTTVNRSSPTQVPGVTGVVAVAAGSGHTLFLRTDGTLWGMGANGDGELGTPAIVVPQTTPVQIASGVAKIAAGGLGTMYITTDGVLWVCGDDSSGQLGDSQTPANVPVDSNDTQVGAGTASANLLVHNDGTLWVQNNGGTPTPVPGVTGVVDAYVGSYAATMLYLKGDGTLWRLMPDNSSTPLASGVISAGAGLSYAVWLKTDGTLWGDQLHVQDDGFITFGDGTGPVQVDSHVLSVSAAGWHFLYVKDDQSLWGQGTAWDGLIPGDNLHQSSPSAPVELMTGVASAVANDGQNLYVTTDGTLWTLGTGWDSSAGPAAVVDTSVLSAASNGAGTLYVKADGVLRFTPGVQGTLGTAVQLAANVTTVTGGTPGWAVFLQAAGSGTAPVITAQPLSAVVAAESATTLQVGASGTGPLGYQWFKDGIAVSWARTAQFPIPCMTAADAGTYYVVITNSAGSVTSATATLTINSAPPTITAQPQDQTVTAGETATLTVSAAGSAPLHYQWRKGGVNIVGATSATLVIPNAQATDMGTYKVLVSNVAGSVTSAAAKLTVLQPVVITLQPVSDTVVAGKNATFTVQATGSKTLSYQWRKNGAAIPGATASKLQLTGVTDADAGSYDVVVSNAAGSATSSAATLTVLDKPAITSGPTDLTVTAGQPATFTVTATGTAPLTYQWRLGATDFAGATSATLVIPSAQAADAGNYKVVVTNAAGSVTSTAAHLTVLQPVVITLQPVSAAVVAGKNATFAVQATGTKPLSYQWRKNGVAIAGATANKLQLTAVTDADAGSYDVVVTDTANTVTSTAATLTVLDKPVIVSLTADLTVTIGHPATFAVTATGTAPLTYQWLKGGVSIVGATAATYVIPSATAGDTGNYKVVVTNATGSVTSQQVHLTVH